MHLRPDQLKDSDLFIEVEHKHLVAFLKKYMQYRNVWVIAFWTANAGVVLSLTVYLYFEDTVSWKSVVTNFGVGFLIFFLLLPMHEFIHGLTYKSVGAEKVSYKGSLKQMMIYALADQFVASRKEFIKVAIMPFVAITGMIVIAMFFVTPKYDVALFIALFFHTGGCYGDFAFLSFFHEHRDKGLVTYDDAVKENTLFYRSPGG